MANEIMIIIKSWKKASEKRIAIKEAKNLLDSKPSQNQVLTSRSSLLMSECKDGHGNRSLVFFILHYWYEEKEKLMNLWLALHDCVIITDIM